MVYDAKEIELNVGDEVFLRARIDEIHQVGGDEDKAILKVTWLTTEVVPLIDYLKPKAVEKWQD